MTGGLQSIEENYSGVVSRSYGFRCWRAADSTPLEHREKAFKAA